MIQEIIAFIILGIALAFLIRKFLFKTDSDLLKKWRQIQLPFSIATMSCQ